MALKFNCPKCNKEVVFKFLKIEETGKCSNCNNEIIIPSNVIEITDQSESDVKASVGTPNIPKGDYSSLAVGVFISSFILFFWSGDALIPFLYHLRKDNKLSLEDIMGMLITLVIPALIIFLLGILAIKKINREHKKGKVFAVISMMISLVVLICVILTLQGYY
jgi:hypothetical protein